MLADDDLAEGAFLLHCRCISSLLGVRGNYIRGGDLTKLFGRLEEFSRIDAGRARLEATEHPRRTRMANLLFMKILPLLLALCAFGSFATAADAPKNHKGSKECNACCEAASKCDACCHDKGKGVECKACCFDKKEKK